MVGAEEGRLGVFEGGAGEGSEGARDDPLYMGIIYKHNILCMNRVWIK